MSTGQRGAQHIERDVQDVSRQTTWRKYEEARADRPPEVMRDAELFMTNAKTIKTEVATKGLDVVRSNV